MGTGAGQVVNDADFAAIRGSSSQRPIGRILVTTTQNLADNTLVPIADFPLEEIDTHNFHSTVTNPSRVTPSISGYYRFWGSVFFAARTDYIGVEAVLRKNGTTALPPAGRVEPGPTFATTVGADCTAFVEMNGTTDYIELIARQDNSANVASPTVANLQYTTVLEWEKVRDL